ncbi:MAG: DNA repair protein RadA [Gammaproteobacteria bacterium]
MAKTKTIYSCNACGAQFNQWSGYCAQCNTWDSISEAIERNTKDKRSAGYAGVIDSQVVLLSDVQIADQARIDTGLSELNRVLGGGLVAGSVVLIGGDPGIGKSTLLLQTMCHLASKCKTLYITGEESLQQVTLRARRLALPENNMQLLTETSIERIIAIAEQHKPDIMVIDSIQTMHTEQLSSAPGAVGQVRESTAQLVKFAKQSNIAVLLVGHVTKEGALAGPRVLEHMVDTVLYFEGESSGRLRLLRAVKNRFGAVNELGVFAMVDKGLKQVTNPSALFINRTHNPVPGSVVMISWEGTRPLLVEVQALVDESHIANPRRVVVGLEQNRLAILLAVLHRHAGVVTYDQDVFVNVVGGVKITETAADLALLFAILSSLRNQVLPQDLVVFGEVGLAGEIRPVQSGQDRLKEAAKHGFKRAVVPFANLPPKGQSVAELEVIGVEHLAQALEYCSTN